MKCLRYLICVEKSVRILRRGVFRDQVPPRVAYAPKETCEKTCLKRFASLREAFPV